MAQISNEDKDRLSKLGRNYSWNENQKRQACLKKLPENVQKFMEPFRGSFVNTELAKELMANLKKYPGYKPSEFVKAKMPQIFKGYLNPAHAEQIYYTIDHVPERIYSYGYNRRSLRSSDPEIVARTVARKLQFFAQYDFAADDICDYLEDKVADEYIGYKYYDFNADLMLGDLIAAEIDAGNTRMIRILEDCINGDSDIALRRSFLSGIMKAHNRSLYELLGKLLCAAGLQEGLRQAICEQMDEGVPEAFLYLLQVIRDNNFIRFSSVKRSFGVWLGLMPAEAPDLDRVSEKIADHVYECLSDTHKRDEYLASEDPLKIHVALWSLGFYEVNDLINKIHEFSENGTRHQILTMSFSLHMLGDDRLSHRAAKKLVDQHHDDIEIMAAYIGFFMGGCGFDIAEHKSGVTRFFADDAEALHFYDILKEIYGSLSGKKQTFDKCIFSWYSANISKGDVVTRLAYIAQVLGKSELIDEVCNIMGDSDVNFRSQIIRGLLANPTTDLQRQTLTAALCDKSEYVRKDAFRLVNSLKTPLLPENYLQMEDMLRYKASDARQNLIKLLMQQNDADLEKTIDRLLSDKKEEKRTAALDMIMNLKEDEGRTSLFKRCAQMAKEIDSPTTKEQILLEAILPKEQTEEIKLEAPLFTEKDKYIPVLPEDGIVRESVKTFMRYFPESAIGPAVCPDEYKHGLLGTLKDAILGKTNNQIASETADELKKLSSFVKLHEKDEFNRFGEMALVGGEPWGLMVVDENGDCVIALKSLWKGYLDANIKSPEQYLRMYLMNETPNEHDNTQFATKPYAEKIYGKEFLQVTGFEYSRHIHVILNALMNEYVPRKDLQKLAIAILSYYTDALAPSDLYVKYNSYGRILNTKTISNLYMSTLMDKLDRKDAATIKATFPLCYKLYLKHVEAYPMDDNNLHCYELRQYNRSLHAKYLVPEAGVTIFAYYQGIITKEQMYGILFENYNLSDSLSFLSSAVTAVREKERKVASRKYSYSWRKGAVLNQLSVEKDDKYLQLISSIYDKVIAQVLSVELKRGDSNTIYSKNIKDVERIYGVSNFVSILAAMGKDALERSIYHSTESKKGALSKLLSVCIPDPSDDADTLRKELESTDITDKRLVEASLYAPEWIDIVGDYLGWDGYMSGCYYFIAHMNEWVDDKKKAIIAKHTPLEPEELRNGAFDVEWFKSVYEELGEDRFDVIYDAAKYISDGAKHSRARKYADAVLGKFEVKETEAAISDKRNKDLLMAYPLIPLKGEDDICERYLFLQQFLKESKKFGSQRSASEKTAVEIAMQNLATNAGYSDVTRLTLRMETKLVENLKSLFEEKEIGDVTVKLVIDELGNASISAVKGGKALKSVPAAIKKDEYVKTLTDAKKQLTDQYRRTRQMFEQSMEDRTLYSVEELEILRTNPVVEPLIRNLVFVTENSAQVGFIEGMNFVDYAGNATKLKAKDNVRVAHSFDIYKDGHLSDYQKNLFDRGIVQPFKQVFRELYVKTGEEADMLDSRRYAGNQIQPKKTIALLKSRRWTPDVEDGIQKVYYKDNIVATIYALADWFAPSDIEAPTLEWVAFYDRKTYEAIKIKDVPDIIFSEVMRDVDLAVSVAHAGGVDPQTSHSTIEMRAALVEFTLPLFKLSNVTIEKSHAHIEGKYGNYTVHLGSGVVHKMGGTMINILPVHSQHRGKLFLPFADEDPKTAEIITKILFLAQDSKIKDPSILNQIQ